MPSACPCPCPCPCPFPPDPDTPPGAPNNALAFGGPARRGAAIFTKSCLMAPILPPILSAALTAAEVVENNAEAVLEKRLTAVFNAGES